MQLKGAHTTDTASTKSDLFSKQRISYVRPNWDSYGKNYNFFAEIFQNGGGEEEVGKVGKISTLSSFSLKDCVPFKDENIVPH